MFQKMEGQMASQIESQIEKSEAQSQILASQIKRPETQSHAIVSRMEATEENIGATTKARNNVGGVNQTLSQHSYADNIKKDIG